MLLHGNSVHVVWPCGLKRIFSGAHSLHSLCSPSSTELISCIIPADTQICTDKYDLMAPCKMQVALHPVHDTCSHLAYTAARESYRAHMWSAALDDSSDRACPYRVEEDKSVGFLRPT